MFHCRLLPYAGAHKLRCAVQVAILQRFWGGILGVNNLTEMGTKNPRSCVLELPFAIAWNLGTGRERIHEHLRNLRRYPVWYKFAQLGYNTFDEELHGNDVAEPNHLLEAVLAHQDFFWFGAYKSHWSHPDRALHMREPAFLGLWNDGRKLDSSKARPWRFLQTSLAAVDAMTFVDRTCPKSGGQLGRSDFEIQRSWCPSTMKISQQSSAYWQDPFPNEDCPDCDILQQKLVCWENSPHNISGKGSEFHLKGFQSWNSTSSASEKTRWNSSWTQHHISVDWATHLLESRSAPDQVCRQNAHICHRRQRRRSPVSCSSFGSPSKGTWNAQVAVHLESNYRLAKCSKPF